jgi:outer membrane protein TolC
MNAAKLGRNATRADVALETRRQFYVVVQAIKVAQVAEIAVQFARDDERRVKAMFEVGSVSKADLLRAQVRTAQSERDQLTSRHNVIVQRINLATLMGIKEGELGAIDTVLVAQEQTYDEAALLAEAARNRPDIMAAQADLNAAKASLNAARMARLPYITARGQVTFETRSNNRNVEEPYPTSEFNNESDRQHSAQLALNWDVFNLSAIDSRVSSARARVLRSQESYDALQRNLASEVHQQILAYAEATEGNRVAQRGLESARENLKLTQEKYNVGSATILDLIDAQVQLQNAANDLVRALAAIRVVEAQIRRVRGQAE